MTALDLLVALRAVGVGVAMASTTLCTVANLGQWVIARQVDGLRLQVSWGSRARRSARSACVAGNANGCAR